MNTDTIRDYLDVAATGRTPSAADLEATLAEALDPSAVGIDAPDPAAVRAALVAATRAVAAPAAEGNTGEARRCAAAELARIRDTFGTSTSTTRTGDPGADVRAVIDSIPRGH